MLLRYQHYLENVLEVADEYQEVGDLLLRHATLLATNQDLKEHQRKCAELAEKIRTELQVGRGTPAAATKKGLGGSGVAVATAAHDAAMPRSVPQR